MPTANPRKGSFCRLAVLSTQLQGLHPQGGVDINGMAEAFLAQGLQFILLLQRLSFIFMAEFALQSCEQFLGRWFMLFILFLISALPFDLWQQVCLLLPGIAIRTCAAALALLLYQILKVLLLPGSEQ